MLLARSRSCIAAGSFRAFARACRREAAAGMGGNRLLPQRGGPHHA